MIRVIICDDEEMFIDKYKEELQQIAQQNEVYAEIEGFTSCEKLLFEISDNPDKVDLIYMDIDFGNRMDGMNASQQLRRIGYTNELVFLTKNTEQVFNSFEVEPMYYMVKSNTNLEKMESVFMRAVKKQDKRKQEYIALSCAGDNRNIPLGSIYYFEIVRRIIEVHYDDQVFEFYSTIGKLENMLMNKDFLRVHRAFLVSMKHIAGIKGSEITMDNGDTIPVGRTYMKSLKEALGISTEKKKKGTVDMEGAEDDIEATQDSVDSFQEEPQDVVTFEQDGQGKVTDDTVEM